MRVSVVVPAFNAAPWIARALESIIQQAHTDLEIIVVDDASTDDTIGVVAACGVSCTVLRGSVNRGVAAARNLGVRAATGEVIAFLDADDEWLEGKLAAQLDALEARPDLAVVTGFVRRVFVNASRPDGVIETFFPLLGAALMRRAVFERVGMFDEDLRLGEDLDWFLRLRDAHEGLVVLPRPVLLYRLHAHNITADSVAVKRSILEVLRLRLQRHEGTPPELPEVPILHTPHLEETA
jgi:glycosyltransferase involved in cell wall biosynthesis